MAVFDAADVAAVGAQLQQAAEAQQLSGLAAGDAEGGDGGGGGDDDNDVGGGGGEADWGGGMDIADVLQSECHDLVFD
jgi:hypothetical protein